MKATTRTVAKTGIYVHGIRYLAPVLAPYVSETVMVHVDRSDPSTIDVHSIDGAFIASVPMAPIGLRPPEAIR